MTLETIFFLLFWLWGFALVFTVFLLLSGLVRRLLSSRPTTPSTDLQTKREALQARLKKSSRLGDFGG